MNLWHSHGDTPRRPLRVGPHEVVHLHFGTYPIEAGQRVEVTWHQVGAFPMSSRHVDATWERNEGHNSYWVASIGPFPEGGIIRYQVHAENSRERVQTPFYEFSVGPKIHLALLWHMHQPDYRLSDAGENALMLQLPWVRLHALRDYYSMPALVLQRPSLHLAFNLTPVLIAQLEAYAEQGATDRHLELTLMAPEALDESHQEQILESFFEADGHHQIFPHQRYRELFEMRLNGARFSTADILDLQMWSNLAWFGKEFRDGPVTLVTGEVVDVHRWVVQQRTFSREQVVSMVEEQFKILRAVLPVYRRLQQRGQVEVTTSPYSHPILPILVDSDGATVDRPGATLPRRFSYPEDAVAQIQWGTEIYGRVFGRTPRGMWPAEGAVSQSTIPLYASANIAWIASDAGVLARSGRWGYQASDPDVVCRPYLVEEGDSQLAIYFRDAQLADAIGFRYQTIKDPEVAVSAFVHEVDTRFIQRFSHEEDRIVMVVLDGENAWGGYEADGRPFLDALYRRLTLKSSILTVTPSEYLDGNRERGVKAHPPRDTVHPLFTGSWVDELHSRPGVDLGTWIGEASENRAWEMLGDVRSLVSRAPSEKQLLVRRSLFAAEGSDWFWWQGDDQDSGHDELFGALFRGHLRDVYLGLGLPPSAELDTPFVARRVVWSATHPIKSIAPGDELVIRTSCPGFIVWQDQTKEPCRMPLASVGGVLAGNRRFQAVLGRFSPQSRLVSFRLECTDPACPRDRCRPISGERIEIRLDAGA